MKQIKKAKKELQLYLEEFDADYRASSEDNATNVTEAIDRLIKARLRYFMEVEGLT